MNLNKSCIEIPLELTSRLRLIEMNLNKGCIEMDGEP